MQNCVAQICWTLWNQEMTLRTAYGENETEQIDSLHQYFDKVGLLNSLSDRLSIRNPKMKEFMEDLEQLFKKYPIQNK
jgi:hypothetical protein